MAIIYLQHFEGANGDPPSIGAGDIGANNFNLIGNPYYTAAWSKFGSSSLRVGPSDQFLHEQSHPTGFGSGDFAASAWVKYELPLANHRGSFDIVWDVAVQASAEFTVHQYHDYDDSRKFVLAAQYFDPIDGWVTLTSYDLNYAYTFDPNVEHFIALCRYNGVFYFSVDGTIVQSFAFTQDVGSNAINFRTFMPWSTLMLDEACIHVADIPDFYTNGFTPPTAPWSTGGGPVGVAGNEFIATFDSGLITHDVGTWSGVSNSGESVTTTWPAGGHSLSVPRGGYFTGQWTANVGNLDFIADCQIRIGTIYNQANADQLSGAQGQLFTYNDAATGGVSASWWMTHDVNSGQDYISINWWEYDASYNTLASGGAGWFLTLSTGAVHHLTVFRDGNSVYAGLDGNSQLLCATSMTVPLGSGGSNFFQSTNNGSPNAIDIEFLIDDIRFIAGQKFTHPTYAVPALNGTGGSPQNGSALGIAPTTAFGTVTSTWTKFGQTTGFKNTAFGTVTSKWTKFGTNVGGIKSTAYGKPNLLLFAQSIGKVTKYGVVNAKYNQTGVISAGIGKVTKYGVVVSPFAVAPWTKSVNFGVVTSKWTKIGSATTVGKGTAFGVPTSKWSKFGVISTGIGKVTKYGAPSSPFAVGAGPKTTVFGAPKSIYRQLGLPASLGVVTKYGAVTAKWNVVGSATSIGKNTVLGLPRSAFAVSAGPKTTAFGTVTAKWAKFGQTTGFKTTAFGTVTSKWTKFGVINTGIGKVTKYGQPFTARAVAPWTIKTAFGQPLARTNTITQTQWGNPVSRVGTPKAIVTYVAWGFKTTAVGKPYHFIPPTPITGLTTGIGRTRLGQPMTALKCSVTGFKGTAYGVTKAVIGPPPNIVAGIGSLNIITRYGQPTKKLVYFAAYAHKDTQFGVPFLRFTQKGSALGIPASTLLGKPRYFNLEPANVVTVFSAKPRMEIFSEL